MNTVLGELGVLGERSWEPAAKDLGSLLQEDLSM